MKEFQLKKINLIILLFTLLTTGCDNSSKKFQIDISEKIEALEKKTEELDTEVFLVKMNQDKFSSTSFDPADSKGYQRVDTTSGTFLISLQDVTPYLDGVKVNLQIGNIQFASYSGFSLKISYGKRYPKYDEKETSEEKRNKREIYSKSKREKEESFTKVLRPATWNSVIVFLPDIKPTEFGYMNVSMVTNIVRMSIN